MNEFARFAVSALAAALTALVMWQFPVSWLPRWYWLPMMGVLFVLYLEVYTMVADYWNREELP